MTTQNSQNLILTAFMQFLTSCLSQSSSNLNQLSIVSITIDFLYTGIPITQFVSTFLGSQISKKDIIRDKDVVGVGMANFGMLEREIRRLVDREGDLAQFADFNVYEIYTQNSTQQLIKLLRLCFILSTRAQNSSFYIQKIMTLPQDIQMLFASILKQDGNFAISSSSPTRDQTNFMGTSSGGSGSYCGTRDGLNRSQEEEERQVGRREREHILEVVDKLYELELENQRLQGEIKKYQQETIQSRQTLLQLLTQIDSLKTHNKNLQQTLQQQTILLQQTQSKNLHLTKIQLQKKTFLHDQYLQNTLNKYKEDIQILKTQYEIERRKAETKLTEVWRDLEREVEANGRLREELGFYQSEMEVLFGRFQDFEKSVAEGNKNIKALKQQNSLLRQTEITLKFQISYKNQQILQLKQLLEVQNPNHSSFPIRGHRYSQHYDSNNFSLGVYSSKLLTSQFQFPQNQEDGLIGRYSISHSSSPNLIRNSFNFRSESDELRELRIEVKQLRAQYEKCKGYKNRMKDLEYQKNKLTKILKEYQCSRGEENQILTGVLYEMQAKMKSNRQDTNLMYKASISRSTLGEDLNI